MCDVSDVHRHLKPRALPLFNEVKKKKKGTGIGCQYIL